MAQIVSLPLMKCFRCGYQWIPKKTEVKVCARCRSCYFDTPRKYKHPNPKMAMQRKKEAEERRRGSKIPSAPIS